MHGFDPAALKRARVAKGLTQLEAAKLVGLARENYVNFEKGHRTVGAVLLGRFAKGFGVKTRDLVSTPPEEMTLLDLRQLSGRTRSEAAKAMGFKSVTSYADMETGERLPNAEQRKILARLFRVSQAEIERAASLPPRDPETPKSKR